MKHLFLLGYPVAHSISPAMHNPAFRAIGLDWEYSLLETPPHDLARVAERLRADDCAGANVTIPHKQAIIQYLDELSDSARKIGAVNTIYKRDGRLIGDNTDTYGFLQSLTDASFSPRGKNAVVLGAGGVARAAAFALAGAGANSIHILNRTEGRAVALADALRFHFPTLKLGLNRPSAIKKAHLIVNATSVGMVPNVLESPMRFGYPFSQGTVAFDLVYRPARTKFLSEAEAAEARTIGGLDMLVYQGIAAFELWTGRDAPVDLMFQAARAALDGVPYAAFSHRRRITWPHAGGDRRGDAGRTGRDAGSH